MPADGPPCPARPSPRLAPGGGRSPPPRRSSPTGRLLDSPFVITPSEMTIRAQPRSAPRGVADGGAAAGSVMTADELAGRLRSSTKGALEDQSKDEADNRKHHQPPEQVHTVPAADAHLIHPGCPTLGAHAGLLPLHFRAHGLEPGSPPLRFRAPSLEPGPLPRIHSHPPEAQ